MFFGKKKARDYSWDQLAICLTSTEEWFKALVEKRRLAVAAAISRSTDRQVTKEFRAAEEAWKEICEIRDIREELIRHGWLPPREKDVRARRTAERGTLFEGMPTKWALNRRYEKSDFSIALDGVFADE